MLNANGRSKSTFMKILAGTQGVCLPQREFVSSFTSNIVELKLGGSHVVYEGS